MALVEDPPVLDEPVPLSDPSRRFTMEIKSRGGTVLTFKGITYAEVIRRMDAAEPYGFTFLSLSEEAPCGSS